MTVVASYDAYALAEWVERRVRSFGAVLGWSIETGEYHDVVDDALGRYGTDDIGAATDLHLLRAHAYAAAMERVCSGLATRYDTGTDGQTMARSQMYKAATDERKRADAMVAGALRARGGGLASIALARTATPFDRADCGPSETDWLRR